MKIYDKQEVARAVARQSEVRRLNAPTTAENARRRAHNAKIKRELEGLDANSQSRAEELKKGLLDFLWMPHQLPKWTRVVLRSESLQLVSLSARTPEEWRQRIDAIKPMTLRGAAACIVWWDFFGGRMPEDRWPQLDALVQHGSASAVPDAELEAALNGLGYSPRMAWVRSTTGSDYGRTKKTAA